LQVLHRVVDRHAGGHDAAGGVDVKEDVPARVLGAQQEQLRADPVRDVVVDGGAENYDPLAQQALEHLLVQPEVIRLLGHLSLRRLPPAGHATSRVIDPAGEPSLPRQPRPAAPPLPPADLLRADSVSRHQLPAGRSAGQSAARRARWASSCRPTRNDSAMRTCSSSERSFSSASVIQVCSRSSSSARRSEAIPSLVASSRRSMRERISSRAKPSGFIFLMSSSRSTASSSYSGVPAPSSPTAARMPASA